MEHHSLDPYPIPKEKHPMFINEPQRIDKSLFERKSVSREPEKEDDNIRVYFPMDINEKSVLRRLDFLISRYGEANVKNEFDFSMDVDQIISQVEIYDQIWYVRHMPEEGDHSREAIGLVGKIVERLENIPDGGAECFPFDLIAELKREYQNVG